MKVGDINNDQYICTYFRNRQHMRIYVYIIMHIKHFLFAILAYNSYSLTVDDHDDDSNGVDNSAAEPNDQAGLGDKIDTSGKGDSKHVKEFYLNNIRMLLKHLRIRGHKATSEESGSSMNTKEVSTSVDSESTGEDSGAAIDPPGTATKHTRKGLRKRD